MYYSIYSIKCIILYYNMKYINLHSIIREMYNSINVVFYYSIIPYSFTTILTKYSKYQNQQLKITSEVFISIQISLTVLPPAQHFLFKLIFHYKTPLLLNVHKIQNPYSLLIRTGQTDKIMHSLRLN